MVIYIHGLNSNPNADKALLLKAYFEARNEPFAALHYDSSKLETALKSLQEQLQEIDEKHKILGGFRLVGASLGGFFASQLSNIWQCKKVLINPCLFPSKMLPSKIGKQTIFETGETYILTQETIDIISKNENEIRKYDTFCFLQMGDEVLDNNLSKGIFSDTFIEQGGHHRFENFERILPEIEAFYHT